MISDITMSVDESPNKGAVKTSPKIQSAITMADKYRESYGIAWMNLPHWKRIALEQDKANGITNSHLMDEFTKEVSRLAEQE